MREIKDLWFRLKALLGRRRFDRDLDEEVRFHLEMEAEKHRARGLSAEEAYRRARVSFGGEDRFKEAARTSWGVSAVTDIGSDIRFALRQLLRHRSFSVLAVLTLSLGLGGTVALASVVNAVMVRPLPLPEADRVVTFWSDYNWRGEEFDHVKDVPEHFEELAAFSNYAYTLRTDAGSSLIIATVASVELFDVMGVEPLLGRTLRPGEDRPGAAPVVVLDHRFWQQEFGADPGIVGRPIQLGGESRTVVGVMPEGFYFPTPESSAFVPLDLDPDDPAYAGNGWLVLTGRLAPGSTDVQVARDLDRITTALGARYEYPEAWDKTRNPYVTPLREYLFGDVRPALLLLLGAVGLLLLMACVNVTALILTKTVDRAREMSVRTALGAGRARLVRQVLTESVLLGLVAGALGVVLATFLFELIVAGLPLEPAFRDTVTLDWTALASALVLAIVCGSAIALVPIRNLLRGEVEGSTFAERTSGSSGSRESRTQRVLVFAEVALAVVMVTGASLLIRTVGELQAVDLGFDPTGVLTLDVLLPEDDASPAERAAFFDRLVERTAAIPGISGATLLNRLPLRDGGYQATVSIEDRPDLQGPNRPNVMYRPMSVDGFEVLGARLVAGRGLLPSDLDGSPPVAVVNETFARTIWGGESPLGRRYQNGFGNTVEVVGVVHDMAVTDLTGSPPMVGYYPWDQEQRGASYAILAVKAPSASEDIVPAVRALVRDLDPRAAIGRIETMSDAVAGAMAEPLRLRFFLGLFALLGLMLGAIGVYGVVSYSVERRRAEFGVRMALGAQPGRLVGTVVRQGMIPVAAGVLVGTTCALLVSRVLGGFLFQVEPHDPVSLALSAGVLLATGVAAALIPALRAGSTDPAGALRAD